jgi:ABC-type dipeptide/oligopeptide/nickel transport system ATPase component
MNILLIGACGVGKTWVMKSLMMKYSCHVKKKIGKIYFHSNNEVNIIGKYEGNIFDGSDRLSMAAVSDTQKFVAHQHDKVNIFEGDRFTNSTFIRDAGPVIIRINGDGAEGRMKRLSTQTQRHIKSISTRVGNITPTYEVNHSNDALKLIVKLIENGEK